MRVGVGGRLGSPTVGAWIIFKRVSELAACCVGGAAAHAVKLPVGRKINASQPDSDARESRTSRPTAARRSRRWRRRRGGRGTATSCGYVVHTHAWCQRGDVTRERREHIQILLDAAGSRRAVVGGCPVDRRQRIRAFGQQYLELGSAAGNVEVGGLPPDDELPVRRSSQRLGEDTTVCADSRLIGAQVVIVRKKVFRNGPP